MKIVTNLTKKTKVTIRMGIFLESVSMTAIRLLGGLSTTGADHKIEKPTLVWLCIVG